MGAVSTPLARPGNGPGQLNSALDVARFVDRMAGAATKGFHGLGELRVGSGGELAAALSSPAESKHRFAWVGAQGSAAELLSELTSTTGESLVVFAPSGHAAGWCVYVADRRVVGVVGPAPDGTFESWSSAFNARHGIAEGAEGRRRESSFVLESVIAALARCDRAGAKAWITSGGVDWLAYRHDDASSPGLSQLILEYARRADELPSIEAFVGGGDRILVPVSEPGASPTPMAGREELDFHDDPDSAAMSEWSDVRRLWSLCDGTSEVDRIVERAMLGRFRGLAAVAALLERGHVVAVQGLAEGEDRAAANRAEYSADDVTPHEVRAVADDDIRDDDDQLDAFDEGLSLGDEPPRADSPAADEDPAAVSWSDPSVASSNLSDAAGIDPIAVDDESSPGAGSRFDGEGTIGREWSQDVAPMSAEPEHEASAGAAAAPATPVDDPSVSRGREDEDTLECLPTGLTAPRAASPVAVSASDASKPSKPAAPRPASRRRARSRGRVLALVGVGLLAFGGAVFGGWITASKRAERAPSASSAGPAAILATPAKAKTSSEAPRPALPAPSQASPADRTAPPPAPPARLAVDPTADAADGANAGEGREPEVEPDDTSKKAVEVVDTEPASKPKRRRRTSRRRARKPPPSARPPSAVSEASLPSVNTPVDAGQAAATGGDDPAPASPINRPPDGPAATAPSTVDSSTPPASSSPVGAPSSGSSRDAPANERPSGAGPNASSPVVDAPPSDRPQ
ncbi:MAG: hypothetical protein B7733_18530 [Myxococcales bacterium FL481]|nr:MAG: hypothetical protein B7733_18530 [Myxococcales bacterium FL481]